MHSAVIKTKVRSRRRTMIIILMEDASLLCETTEMRMTALQIRVQKDTPFYFKFHISNSFSRDICTLFSGDDDDVENDSTNNKEGTTMPRLSSLSKDSDSDNNDTIGTSVRTLPARRSQSIAQTSGLTTNRGSNSSSSSKDDGLLHAGNAKKFVRHFSQGSYPPLSNSASPKKKKNCVEGGGNGGKINTNNDDFERPLIRLKYGDRVQVVSMDSRGWVKLARGYGYIRLENDKQLVKG